MKASETLLASRLGYGRALRKLIIDKEHEERNLRVIFADVCEEWYKSADLDLLQAREKTRNNLKDWGAEFLDKSPSNPDQRRRYDELLHGNIDSVFIATPDRYHIEVAKYWLTGNCKRIFIEKPLSNDPAEARAWMLELAKNKRDRERLTQLDHYLLKIHAQFKYKEHLNQILAKIARVKHLRFYLLEDHSGTDQSYCEEATRKKRKELNGPIEIENRTATLQDGLSLDLLPHLLAILSYFGDPRTFEVTELRPAKYVGVEYDDTREAGIRNETFAAIEFTFENFVGVTTSGEAYIGKGILGSRKYPSMKGNVKVLEVEGQWGSRIEFDFTNSIVSAITKSSPNSQAYLEPEPIVDLEPDPYYYLLRNVVFKRWDLGADLGIPIMTGAKILEKIVSEITSRTKTAKLSTYLLGNKKNRLPPMLEDLLAGGKNEIPILPLT